MEMAKSHFNPLAQKSLKNTQFLKGNLALAASIY